MYEYVTQPSFFQYMSQSPKFSNIGNTTQFSPMYVTQSRILWCMSHHPVFLQCMSHSPLFFDVCHTTQFVPMYESWTTLLLNPALLKDESLWSSQWCLIRTHHNSPSVGRKEAGNGYITWRDWVRALTIRRTDTPAGRPMDMASCINCELTH